MTRPTSIAAACPHMSDAVRRLNAEIVSPRNIRASLSAIPDDGKPAEKADAWDSSFFVGIEKPVAEYRFHKTRKWRFDYAWPDFKVALEVEGGVWSGGRHTRGAGFLRDIEKYNAAAVAGWRVLRCTPDTLATAATLAMLREVLP